jgi:hypothetical protein
VNEAEETPPLVGAPRHLRRRIFHQEIPDALLVRGVDILPSEAVGVDRANREAGVVSARVRAFGRKRLVALIVVILVSMSIPALALALILVG